MTQMIITKMFGARAEVREGGMPSAWLTFVKRMPKKKEGSEENGRAKKEQPR